jgi:hypothetical protein
MFVDDCLIFAPLSSTIDGLITSSLSTKFLLQDKGNVSVFLGAQVKKDTMNQVITLTQPGLIEQVITDVGMYKYSKGRDTTADAILHPGPTGVSRQ